MIEHTVLIDNIKRKQASPETLSHIKRHDKNQKIIIMYFDRTNDDLTSVLILFIVFLFI